MTTKNWLAGGVFALALAVAAGPNAAQAQSASALLGEYGGDGIRTSLLGTHVRAKEFIVYPFYEYTRTRRFEYKASDFRYVGEVDYTGGTLTEHEALLYLGYAPSDSLLIEFESALHAKAQFRKAANDSTALPAEIRESGLGDTEVQVRWRVARETASRPDTVVFLKTVFPLQKNKRVLGTRDWEVGTGFVLTKSYAFGTLALRGGIDYDSADRKFVLGEYSLDYMKRLAPQWGLALALEGHESQVSVIAELQYSLGRDLLVKINSGFGLSKKDRQFAPEVGIMFRF